MFLPCDNFSHGESSYLRKMEQEHDEFTERLRKSLYFGQLPGTDRPSLPLTDLAVKYYTEAAPKELGKLDHYWAASTARAACMTPSSMVAGMMYVKRLRKRKSEYLSQISSSELFLISVMMASKFLYDEGVDEEVFNDEWATSGNLDTEDVNELEREFLSAIEWELFVRPDEFKDSLNRIEKQIALKQGLDRGWFSYTDLELLTRDFSLLNVCDHQLRQLAQVIGVSSLAYIAGLLTMVSSTIMATTASSALVHFGSTALPSLNGLTPITFSFSEPTVTTSDGVLLSPSFDSLEQENLRSALCNETNMANDQPNDILDFGIKGSSAVEETETSKDGKNKHSGQFLGGFLSPFIALVTLKDALVKFSQTALDQETERLDDVLLDGPATEICSDGPCLLDSWPNCRNFSSEYDWSAFKSQQARRSSGHDWSGFKSQQARKTSGQTHMHHGIGQYNSDRGGQTTGSVCCCKNSGLGTDIKHGLHYRYMDSFNIGFTTSSAFPLLVT